ITHKKELEAITDKKARQVRERELADELRAHNTALGLAGRYELDDVIDPADTRIRLIAGLEMLNTKREELPRRKHGNVPL
ncbi:MAG: hypothetical protein QF448_07895, partial [Candidatus Thalassarchaeaceae archaeon]|nr:hypothetical protein [Candidatus Thalassarchaeaceae archaeon]